ncbi:MAG: GHKL domain-containing protein [Chitinophaga sp.]|uniref:sensor histidine kinase n=1 Tax=Chitinophaga sp. TaxID=1869181 RepID=UPI0025BC77EF|nr:ATP-binding protein [Chitinophaga sp.]MBV8254710.1 GHKL domain-containing protein [Chitinophaga sp.]
MRQRIRITLTLMIICILGIFLFQGYWLYNSYRFNEDQFSREISDALRSATFFQRYSDARRYIRYYVKDQDSLKKPIKGYVMMMEELGTPKDNRPPGAPPARIVKVKPMARQEGDIISSPSRLNGDTMARQISEIIITNHNRDSDSAVLARVDSAFKSELNSRQITTRYKLDTFHMNFSGLERGSFKDSIRRRMPNRTRKVPVKEGSNLFVQATFESPLQFVIQKMLWTLIASLVLMILTVLSFVYMLRTILKQKRLSEVKNDFINNMTHELKTPIATVSAAVEALQHFNALNDPEKTARYLNTSKQELQRLSDLVEKVLHIATEEKEEIELFREETDLNEIIDNILSNHQLKSNSLQLRYDNNLKRETVYLDKTHIANAINNLVDNAIKYSGEKPYVHIQVWEEKGMLKIRVKDNGIGIPRSYQESIFDKFFRVPTGNLHKVKGFGLGLSYVRKIVELHGGTIAVHSEPDKGSEFVITIPATKSAIK